MDEAIDSGEPSNREPEKISCERALLFRTTVQTMFRDISSGVGLERFTKLYGDLLILKNHKTRILKLYSKLKQSMVDQMMEDFDCCYTQANIEKKFVELSKLIDDNLENTGRIAWRPPGDVEEHVRSPVMLETLKQLQDCREFIKQKESRIALLKEQMSESRSEAHSLSSQMDQLIEQSENNCNTSRSVMFELKRDAESLCAPNSLGGEQVELIFESNADNLKPKLLL